MLRGEKVILREKRLEDSANDYAWGTDEELARLDATIPFKMPLSNYVIRYKRN